MEKISSNHINFFHPTVLEQIREKFAYVDADPFSGNRIFLDSSSGSLRLKSSVEALFNQSLLPDQIGRANPSSKKTGEEVAAGIEAVKVFLGVKDGTIMPAMSSTHAIFRVVHSILANEKSGNVVTTNLEHPSVYDATYYYSEMFDHEHRTVSLDPQSGRIKIESIMQFIDKKTRLLAITHGSNITGAIIDLKKIVSSIKEVAPNAFVIADGVQYAPHAPVDVNELGVDSYIFGPYKVFCVKGIGFGYISPRLSKLPHEKLTGKADDDWILGSAEDATYSAWNKVVEYLIWLGSFYSDSKDSRSRVVSAMNASKQHVKALLNRCLEGTTFQKGLLNMKHVTLHGMDNDIDSRLCLILFNLKGLDSYQAVEYYRRNKIRVHNRVKDIYSRRNLDALGINEGVRLSACHYNSPEEIDKFLYVTEKAADLNSQAINSLRQLEKKSGFGEG